MNIGELKLESDISYNKAIAKRNALEKAHSRLVVVYKEDIFRADPETICLVRTIKETKDNQKNSNLFELNYDRKDKVNII